MIYPAHINKRRECCQNAPRRGSSRCRLQLCGKTPLRACLNVAAVYVRWKQFEGMACRRSEAEVEKTCHEMNGRTPTHHASAAAPPDRLCLYAAG